MIPAAIIVIVWLLIVLAYLVFLLRFYKESPSVVSIAFRWAGIIFSVSSFALYMCFYLAAVLLVILPVFKRGLSWRRFVPAWFLTGLFLMMHLVLLGLAMFILGVFISR